MNKAKGKIPRTMSDNLTFTTIFGHDDPSWFTSYTNGCRGEGAGRDEIRKVVRRMNGGGKR